MGEVKKTPRLRFHGFFGDWRNKRLDEISEFRRGSFPQPYGLPEWYDDVNGSPFVQVYDVDDNFKLKPDTKQKISVIAQPKSVFVPKGSVIITIQGSIGRVAITQYDSFVDRTLLIFTTLTDQLNKWFFSYQLDLLFENEKRIAPGGTIKTITKEVLSAFSIGLPSLPEQQKIAEFLTTVDKRIELLEKKKTLLETYKKGVMKKIFNQEIRFKDDNGNDFPDWEEFVLNDLGDTLNGLTGKTKYDFDKGSSKYIQYKQVFGDSKIDPNGFGLVDVGETEKQTEIKYGDILFTTSSETPNEIGMSSVFMSEIQNVYLNSFCFGFRPKSLENLIPNFSRFLFRSEKVRSSIVKLAQGSTRFNMSKTNFLKIRVRIPSVEEQVKISEFLSSIDNQIELLETQIEKSKTWKKGLLQKMFV